MKAFNRVGIMGFAALAIAGAAYGQVPSTNDTSDLGRFNTGGGAGAINPATTGSFNTAYGSQALHSNTTGNFNTATGEDALYSNTTGSYNTAAGQDALSSNTTGYSNTASGNFALNANTAGYSNTASGASALETNNEGIQNSAFGEAALSSNTNGIENTAFGFTALQYNTTGSNNLALGYQAGIHLTTGSNNIDIGNVGVAGESSLIRIGTKGTHKGIIFAGITNSVVTGSAVYVTASGRLGVLASSQRYKTAVAPLGERTGKLRQLRPVSFHLKADPKGAIQYGLIAEEVEKVYPELVIRDEGGTVQGVRYDELAPMLLNELQQQQTKMAAQDQHSAAQDAKISQLTGQLAELHAALDKLQSKDEVFAKR